MVKIVLMLLSVLTSISLSAQGHYEWAVIGAGPAGIISVAVLLDNNVDPDSIVWLDPEFTVGRLGKYYCNVPSNLKAFRYTRFLTRCSLFNDIESKAFEEVKHYNQQQEPFLRMIIDPLQDITQYLCQKVSTKYAIIDALEYKNNNWQLINASETISAKKVILATGSHPKRMSFQGPEEIPLDVAIDEELLKTMVTKDDKVMVIGSAHSALLVVKFLSDMNVKKIINVYTKEPTYGMYGGLEGITAYWSKERLEKQPPENLVRIVYDSATIAEQVKLCTKIIYAFGFERNTLCINGSWQIHFDYKTGIIQPYLYGIGIAFPEQHTTKEGTTISLIGVNSFMEYAQRLVPTWIAA